MFSRKLKQKSHDSLLLASTQIVRKSQIFSPIGKRLISLPPKLKGTRTLFKSKKCYICKEPYRKIGEIYHSLCPSCADYNIRKRNYTPSMQGYRALITGGRIKIGFETALKLLRGGAEVLITTRFTNDAARRFQQQNDFSEWKHRLSIYALDLKHLPSVESFIQYLIDIGKPLDILINNAAQTIRKPDSYYIYMARQELKLKSKTPCELIAGFSDPDLKKNHSRFLLGSIQEIEFLDENDEPIDFASKNSWCLALDEIAPLEMVEVMIINATSPGILCAKLKPLLLKSQNKYKFIVNVSAMEGQFSRKNKTHRHPHTNMAKAALNMITRTSAKDYVQDNIYITSVDTGWVTEEHPFPIRQKNRAKGVVPPLDCIDGASRILAPIFNTINGDKALYGVFLKDYAPTDW
ncbi:SDR family NAD(P)-dependent oxidoreductase [Microbulbifer sp. CNSA002]|uniref:SDR family NAD(P)-dependent oxidoreductase n=1 Tax=unclassified Microbulbifer TaxID=2619833 RepID=UPI0039B3712F